MTTPVTLHTYNITTPRVEEIFSLPVMVGAVLTLLLSVSCSLHHWSETQIRLQYRGQGPRREKTLVVQSLSCWRPFSRLQPWFHIAHEIHTGCCVEVNTRLISTRVLMGPDWPAGSCFWGSHERVNHCVQAVWWNDSWSKNQVY